MSGSYYYTKCSTCLTVSFVGVWHDFAHSDRCKRYCGSEEALQGI